LDRFVKSVRHPYTALSFLIADSASSTLPPEIVRVEDLLHGFHGMAGKGSSLRDRATDQGQARHGGAPEVVEVKVAQAGLVDYSPLIRRAAC
jgi:hypothetical protein